MSSEQPQAVREAQAHRSGAERGRSPRAIAPLIQGFRPSAILLDLDGTLVDSEPLHFAAHERFLASVGITCTIDDLEGNIGKGDDAFYRDLCRRQGLDGVDIADWCNRKTDVLMDIYREGRLQVRPGMLGLLDRAAASGIFIEVVTSSERRLCTLSLEVTGLAQRLPARICREDVRRHKPDPEPYLLAAERLGLPPERCLVIEDSESGIRSAKAAGCRVVAYAGLVSVERQMDAGAEVCVEHGDEVVW